MLDGRIASQNFTTDRGNTMFQQLYNNQHANGLPGSDGWPQNLRRIAVVNGSLTGSKATKTPNGSAFIPFSNNGEQMLNIRGFQRIHINLPVGSLTFRTHIASLEAYSMPDVGAKTKIARFKKLFNDKTVKAPNINSRGNMDNVPGGFYNAQGAIAGSTTSQNTVPGFDLNRIDNWRFNRLRIDNFYRSISEILGGSEWYVHKLNPIHSFIPTFSSLAHQQPNQSWSNPLDFNLTCSSNTLTPFDSYYGEAANTQHTSFTKESADWLLKELNHQPQQPVYPVTLESFTGPDVFCVNETVTFGFENECKLTDAAAFTVGTGLQIVSRTISTVTVRGAITGSSTVNVTLSTGQVLTRNVYVGVPVINGNLILLGNDIPSLALHQSNDYCEEVPIRIEINNIESRTLEVEMRKTAGTNTVWDGELRSGFFTDAVIFPSCNEYFSFQARARNACGWSEWRDFSINLDYCEDRCVAPSSSTAIQSPNFVISPVPADTQISIGLASNPQ